MSDNSEYEEEQWMKKDRVYKDWSQPTSTHTPTETMKDIKYLEAVDWPERGLRKETFHRFGVKMKTSVEFGPSKIEKVFFPYCNQAGKIVGYKVKNLLKDKSEKGHFYSIGHVGVSCQLFGQERVRKNAKY